MQIPYRKPGKYMTQRTDNQMTQAKFDELNSELEKLLKTVRPPVIKEVNRLSLTGDFSENHAYQMAKGKLRGINARITEIEYILKNAEIIKPNKNNNTVQIGHTVVVETNDKPFDSHSTSSVQTAQGKQKTYQILGSAETNPTIGTISRNSPLGSALLGKKVGDTLELQLKDKKIEYKIIAIK